MFSEINEFLEEVWRKCNISRDGEEKKEEKGVLGKAGGAQISLEVPV